MLHKLVQNSHGFTLIELLLVITIIGTLASAALPLLAHAAENATILKIRNDLQSIDGALAICATTNGRIPTPLSTAQLTALGYFTAEPAPPATVMGYDLSDDYKIDEKLRRAYVLFTTNGKTVRFYSDTPLTHLYPLPKN